MTDNGKRMLSALSLSPSASSAVNYSVVGLTTRLDVPIVASLTSERGVRKPV